MLIAASSNEQHTVDNLTYKQKFQRLHTALKLREEKVMDISRCITYVHLPNRYSIYTCVEDTDISHRHMDELVYSKLSPSSQMCAFACAHIFTKSLQKECEKETNALTRCQNCTQYVLN